MLFISSDVLKALSQPDAGSHSLLLDSDCVWTRPDPKLARLVQSDTLLLLDADQSRCLTLKYMA